MNSNQPEELAIMADIVPELSGIMPIAKRNPLQNN
jgi:hypothetical protein